MKIDTVVCGDCLDVMAGIGDDCIDLVLTDPPYGTSECKWDTSIPFRLLWGQLMRIVKPGGTIAITAIQPFTSLLITSNIEMFKYCWIWEKSIVNYYAQAKGRPLNTYEEVVIFSDGGVTKNANLKMTYNPQGTEKCLKSVLPKQKNDPFRPNRIVKPERYIQTVTNYPKNIIRIKSVSGKRYHPTQKPVALMEYIIETYTNKGDTVLDFAIGSGTTAIAAIKSNRHFYGCDIAQSFVDISNMRIEEARVKLNYTDKLEGET